jgi:outer membrane protein TolC
MNFGHALRTFRILGLALLAPYYLEAADARHLTLTEAVHLAIAQNRGLTIARLKVVESEQKQAGEHSSYFPSLTNQSNLLHVTALQGVGVPAGAFGTAAGSLVPSQNINLPQGRNTYYSSGTMLSQPLTQLFRIHATNQIAAAELSGSREDLKKAENQVALEVHSLYFGILIARLQKDAAERQSAYAAEQLRENEDDIRNGSALRLAAIQGRAGVLESRQAALTADLQISDLTTELNDVLGLPLDTVLDLDSNVPASFDERPREEYVKTAWSENPEIRAAKDAVRKAEAGVTAAKTAYIPDVTAYARDSYQDGVPLLVHNFGTFGVNLSWDVFDFGKRRAAVKEREAQLAQAQQNLELLKDGVAVSIEKSYNKLTRTKSLVAVANQVVVLRQENERLANNQLAQGVVLAAERSHATAATYKAEADLLQANLGYLLAWAELQQAIGHTPGL